MASHELPSVSTLNFDHLMRHVRVIPWEADVSTWRFTHVGEQALDILGHPVEAWYEQDFWTENLHPKDRDWAIKFCKDSSRRLSEFEFNYRFRAKDGNYLLLHDIVNVEKVDGVPTYFSGFMIDITKQRRLSDDLWSSQVSMHKMLDYAPDAMILVSQDGTIDYANGQFTNMFGYSPTEVRGRKVEEFLPETSRERHVMHRAAYAEHPEVRAMSMRSGLLALRKDGTEFPVEIGLAPLPSLNGTLTCCAIRDVSNRIGLEQGLRTRTAELEQEIVEHEQAVVALRGREAQLRLILSSTAEAIYGIDLLGQCTFANTSCLEMLGYSNMDELRDQNMHNLIHHTRANGEPYPETECRIYKAFRVDQATHVDDEVLWRKDGTSFPVEYWSYPIREGSKLVGSVVTFLDISVRKHAEDEAHTLRNQLAHTSRVTALGELAASLAHELNQPLSAVVSNAQAASRLLSRQEPDTNEVLEALSDIADDGLRAGNVIRRLRSLLRGEETERAPLNINELIQEVVDMVHSESIIENIQTVLKLDPQLPSILGDRTQLQQVLLNLVLNAGDAMRQIESGSRTLTVRTEVHHENAVTVRVSDTGPGIAKNHIEDVFEPFFTTKSSGLGMGLSINRTIVESCGGRIWAENPPEGGAAFSFSLPVYKEEQE